MKTIFYFLFTFCLISTTQSFAQTQIFIKAADNDGNEIKGGSRDERFPDAIEALAYSEGDAACGFTPGGGGSACTVVTGAFNFTMNIDKSVILLKKAMYLGKPLKTVDVSFVRNGDQQIFYIIHMEEVFINAISESGAGEAPTYFVGFDPTRIKWTNFPQNPDGSAGDPIPFGWDRETQNSF